MQEPDNIYRECGEMLRTLREATGTTKEAMAEALEVDRKTYIKYETGQSAPTVPAFIRLFSHLHHDALRPVLNYLYPDVYEHIAPGTDPAALRNALVHYFGVIASDHEIRELTYLLIGGHGSNWRPQLELMTMIYHLPLRDRITVAIVADQLYSLAHDTGTLVNSQNVTPDVGVFRDGLNAAQAAVRSGDDRYTTSGA